MAVLKLVDQVILCLIPPCCVTPLCLMVVDCVAVTDLYMSGKHTICNGLCALQSKMTK